MQLKYRSPCFVFEKTAIYLHHEPSRLCARAHRALVTRKVLRSKNIQYKTEDGNLLPSGPGGPTGPGDPRLPFRPDIPGVPRSKRCKNVTNSGYDEQRENRCISIH